MSNVRILNYWDEFYKTHPDPTEFIDFIKEDPILTKIWNFACIPNIFSDFENYPFSDKIEEFRSITKEDIKYLSDKDIREKKYLLWFNYLLNIYDVVREVLIAKDFLNTENKKSASPKDEKEILDLLKVYFQRVSTDEIRIEEDNKTRRITRLTGRYYRLGIFIKIVEIRSKDNHIIEYQHHFREKPSLIDIKETLRGLCGNPGQNGYQNRRNKSNPLSPV